MHRLKPKTIKELAACLALVRGPCISSKADETYMQILEGIKEVELIHPFYDKAVNDTLGILLYQEQLMEVAVNFGFTLEDSYKLMKAVAKKKIDKIAAFQEQFHKLAKERHVPEEAENKVWKIILDAGQYCFNKSHAVAYALLCYQSAYLKYYFPKEYMKNSLTNAYLRKEAMEEVVQECRRMGIKFSSLDLNSSEWEFKLEEDDSIRIGMCAIKSFGKQASDEVTNNRPFKDMEDFLDRITKNKCTKRAIIPGIFAGLFDCFSENRLDSYNEFCELRKEDPIDDIKVQGCEPFSIDTPYDTIEEILLSASLMSNPVNEFKPIGFEKICKGKQFTLPAVIRKVKKHKTKDGHNMAFLGLETADGYIDCTMFPESYQKLKKFCKKDLIITITGKKDGEDSCIALHIA
jgi:DNA polymerase-3 subunit alpha